VEAASSDEQTKAGFEESTVDSALSQCIFCLYGLVVNPDLTNQALVKHKNTGQGDYKSKEYCADLFQYILPYAKQFPVSILVFSSFSVGSLFPFSFLFFRYGVNSMLHALKTSIQRDNVNSDQTQNG
jgi:hypothetical protein